ncbi:UDP-N-acetylmuramate--L-alanine ligase [Kineococcus sp. NUM-3379]
MSAPAPARDVRDLGRVHLVAIGGAGMSGIARLLLARGVPVSGSDSRHSEVLADLAAAGARVAVGHDAAHVADADTLVVSSAVRPGNPELVEARRRGLPVLHRSEALAALMAGRRAAAVAGTHGKTTTSSMLAVALQHAGADPSYAIGGELAPGQPQQGRGAREGSGDVFVAEADESDGSFLAYSPGVAVVTNVEPDHLDHYGTAEAVEQAFAAFAGRIVPGGLLVACADDPGAARLADTARGRGVRVRTYGFSAGADVRLEGFRAGGTGSTTRLLTAGGPEHTLALRVPGEHNALNAAAALTAAVELGADPAQVLAGLATFGGARRRFELRGEVSGVRVVDEYAHHPTEVTAALRAARGVVGPGRVLVVFQPHLVSRTRIFAADFGAALGLADEVVVLDVYVAREDPDPSVSGALVASAVPLPAAAVAFEPDRDAAVARLAERARPGDLVLTVGAGDVTDLGPRLLAALRARA